MNNLSDALKNPFPSSKDINIGIILVGAFIVFEIGSIQELYPIVRSLRLPLIVTILSLGYALYSIIKKRVDYRSFATKSFQFLCIFIIIYAVINTKNPVTSDNIVILFLTYLAYYLIIVASIKNPSQFILLIDCWLLSVLYSSFHAVMQGGLLWGSRWLNDENTISMLAAMAMPFAFMFLMGTKSKLKKCFYLICLSGYVTISVVAHSRGGTLSMFIVGFFCWLLSGNKVRNTIFLVVAVVLVLQFAPPVFFEEMETLEQGTEEGTASDRIYLWGFAFEMFADHPILGIGPLNYPYFFSSYEKGQKYPIGAQRAPHSTPIQWIAEMGIVGIIILLMLQYSMYKNWKFTITYKREYGIEKGNSNFVFYELVTHAIAISQIAFWFAALFLSLLPFPFYWVLPAFSEAWKNIFASDIESFNNIRISKDD